MIHSIFIIIFFVWNFANGNVVDFTVSLPKTANSYRIGEKVSLTCIVEAGTSDLSVIFQHDGKMVVENGLSHLKRYKADQINEKTSVKYVVMIEKLEWSDRGLWQCAQGRPGKKLEISIIVQGSVQPIVSELDVSSFDKKPLGEHFPRILYGKGVKTNPFDLTHNAKIKLSCRTGCSFPKSRHEWSYQNLTTAERPISSVKLDDTKCSFLGSGDGFNTDSSIVIGCDDLQMVGSNEISCKMHDSNESQSVFVLCPGGHKPWALTNGEIIGLSIAVGLAALMLVLFFMSAKKIVNSYRYGSVVGGIRV